MAKSKVAEAKEKQGYTQIARRCGTCLYLAEFIVEGRKNTKCGKGTFAVKKNSSCAEFTFKESE